MGKREYKKDVRGRCLPIQLTSYQRALKFPDTDVAYGTGQKQMESGHLTSTFDLAGIFLLF